MSRPRVAMDLVTVSTDGLTDSELRRMVIAYHRLACDEGTALSHRRWYLRLARELARVIRSRGLALALLDADAEEPEAAEGCLVEPGGIAAVIEEARAELREAARRAYEEGLEL